MSALTQYTIERRFDVPVARVWAAFTDPGLVARWIWGPGAPDVRVEIDLRLNGVFDISMAAGGDGTRAGMRGIYLFLVPEERLIHTLHWDAPVGYNAPGMNPLDEVVAVQFRADGDGSVVVYTHMGIPDDGVSAAEHERSVRVTLDGLAALLAG